jgi:hypothetical protein
MGGAGYQLKKSIAGGVLFRASDVSNAGGVAVLINITGPSRRI